MGDSGSKSGHFGPGCEDFEGPYADRNFRVIHYDYALGQHREEVWKFSNFDALMGTQEPVERYGAVDASFRAPSGNGWKMIEGR